jgi:hypothetical protein
VTVFIVRTIDGRPATAFYPGHAPLVLLQEYQEGDKSCALVPIVERMVLHERMKERCCFRLN